ncbi:hypothetical protein CWB73_03225 [Pseudoalteromonas phenolica]|uniref:DUF3019 domain-containing protein n=1 Tax=Pseudoalteromonas phenolica TaxID=161398 RepID=A0A4Q7IQS9_9GAMM|nr:DUF3019 domain-containing protein [Pseudoalteromonas phenolica]RZQ54793.1 hypothetical protein C1E23_01920 [Pseudoalteromonas phenolica]TMN86612.1 hypothetical protein CWB72_19240 [Pseudoalteromonas phenolica]TMP82858.1 hypothetical protein CWB73_03225 [Pseudoalteromonas phenolica]
MYFRAISLCSLLMTSVSYAQTKDEGPTEILNAMPSKCVALNEGRTCYTDVKFAITAPDIGDYCLRESNSKKILQCWANTKAFVYTLNFGSTQSISYELISKQKRDTLAVTTIEVNWVHKIKSKKRRWRIF